MLRWFIYRSAHQISTVSSDSNLLMTLDKTEHDVIFAANDYKTINVSAVWRTDSCGEANLQTTLAQIVIEWDYARAKLQLHFCLLINIHWSNELRHATLTVAATLFRAMDHGIMGKDNKCINESAIHR